MLYLKQSPCEDSPVIIQPNILKDERGYFMETFKEKEFFENVGHIDFVQENESRSTSGVFRGFHFQKPPYLQSKLLQVFFSLYQLLDHTLFPLVYFFYKH